MDRGTEVKISIVTLAYNNNKCLADFLDSVKQYNDIGEELEIVIVDHNPQENNALETLRTHGSGECIYVSQDNRAGYGAGCNLGASLAHGEILAFMNHDIVLVEPVFKKIVDKFNADPRLGWLGGRMLEQDGSNGCSYGYRFEYRHCCRRNFMWLALQYDLFDERTMFLEGCDVFLRRTVFDLIGGFDENIFFCNEEADLARKIHALAPDYTIRFHPDIRMVHKRGQSMVWPSEGERINVDDNIYYAKKYGLDYKQFLLEEYEEQLKELEEEKIKEPENVPGRQELLAYLSRLIVQEFQLKQI